MTLQVPPVKAGFLPQSLVGRAILFVLSTGAVAFAGPFVVALVVGSFRIAGLTWSERLLRLAMGEFFSALFVTGMVGLAWAVATPIWLPPFAMRACRKMAVCLFIPWIIMLAMVLWPL